MQRDNRPPQTLTRNPRQRRLQGMTLKALDGTESEVKNQMARKRRVSKKKERKGMSAHIAGHRKVKKGGRKARKRTKKG